MFISTPGDLWISAFRQTARVANPDKKVLGKGSSLNEAYFWKIMCQDNWVCLFDEFGGGPQAPETLPKHIKDMKFYPYRSRSWIVPENHGYLKKDAPFYEFKWANFFRTHILLDQDLLAERHTFDEFTFVVDEHGMLGLNDEGKEVIDEALFLASSAEARGLPGFCCPSA